MADGATVDEVRGIVRDEVKPLADSVSLLAAQGEEESSATSQAVVIDSQQWEHMAATFRLYSTCHVVSLLLLAALFGLVGFRLFVQGWRK